MLRRCCGMWSQLRCATTTYSPRTFGLYAARSLRLNFPGCTIALRLPCFETHLLRPFGFQCRHFLIRFLATPQITGQDDVILEGWQCCGIFTPALDLAMAVCAFPQDHENIPIVLESELVHGYLQGLEAGGVSRAECDASKVCALPPCFVQILGSSVVRCCKF